MVEALGTWGVRWIGELGDEDLDPKLLLWDMHRNIDHGAVPDGRTVVQFRFPDVPAKARDWWMVITADDADVCDADPGHPVAVTVSGSLRRMVEVWRGDSEVVRCTPFGRNRSERSRSASSGPAAVVHAVGLRFGTSACVTSERLRSTCRDPLGLIRFDGQVSSVDHAA